MKGPVEFWKKHPDIPGIEVSTLGRVRTLDKVVPTKSGNRFIKGRILKQHISKSNGYSYVGFRIDGKFVSKRVHRLVAQTFIPNPDNLPQVNHKNCNRSDNRVSNLEWCAASYNRQYQEKYGISSTESKGHRLFAIKLSTMEVSHFKSQSEASRVLGVNLGNINSVIKGNRKQVNGYWFTNADDNVDDIINRKLNTIKDRNGKMIDGVFIKNSDLEE